MVASHKNVAGVMLVSARRYNDTCVGLQTERGIAAGCVIKLCWVFPAAMPGRTIRASETGFSLSHFSTAAAAAARH